MAMLVSSGFLGSVQTQGELKEKHQKKGIISYLYKDYLMP